MFISQYLKCEKQGDIAERESKLTWVLIDSLTYCVIFDKSPNFSETMSSSVKWE